MPHSYSAEAWQLRRDRAVERGYIQPCPRGYTYVLVETELRHAVVAAHRSLSLHCRHDELTGMLHHHGRLAGKHAHYAGVVNPTELAKATRIHRTAGRLKHGISGRQRRRVEDGDGDKDFFSDPWAGKVLPMSGSAAANRDEQPDAWRFWSKRREANEEEVRQEGANEEGEDDEKKDDEEGKEQNGDKEEKADEAEGGRKEGAVDFSVLVDVLANEAMRVLVQTMGAGGRRARRRCFAA